MIAIGQSSGRCEGDQREVDGGGGVMVMGEVGRGSVTVISS